MDCINRPIFILQIITLLDSICFGLIYPFISTYLLSIGGDHLTVGLLTMTNLICQLLSGNIINMLTSVHGKRYTLFLVLNIAMLSHILLILTNSYWFTILARCIFSTINQSQNLCKDLILRKATEEVYDFQLFTFSILSGCGYIIGPIISGFIFSMGFLYVALLAAVLTLINIYLIMILRIEEEQLPPVTDDKSLLEETVNEVTEVVENFSKCELEKNWDIIAFKFLFTSSTTIFFSKFTQILKHNFNSDSIMVGYTTSYMNGLTFAATYYCDHFVKNGYLMFVLTQNALLLLIVSLLFACLSPTYTIYLVMCIPVIFARGYINTIWKTLFRKRNNDSLIYINDSIAILAGIITPILFGITCNIISHYAVIIFSILPIMLSLCIVNDYTKKYELYIENSTSDKNKDD